MYMGAWVGQLRAISQKLSGVGRVYLVGTLVGGCRCTMSWCDLDLTFDLDFENLGYISQTVRCRRPFQSDLDI